MSDDHGIRQRTSSGGTSSDAALVVASGQEILLGGLA